jgi:hypothetical protein
MLKLAPNGSSLRPSSSAAQQLASETTLQKLSNPIPVSNDSETSKIWHSYVNGGAAADDARYVEQAREKQASYAEAMRSMTPGSGAGSKSNRLIEIAPEEKFLATSANANLLIDLDMLPEVGMSSHQRSYASAATPQNSSRAGASMNLLE